VRYGQPSGLVRECAGWTPSVQLEPSAKPEVRLGRGDECLLRRWLKSGAVFAVVRQEGHRLAAPVWRCSAPFVRLWLFQSAV